MHINRNSYLKTLAVTGAMALLAAPAFAGEMASGAEIKQILEGNTLAGAAGSGPFSEYYDPDGTIRGDGYTASWKMDGEEGCMDYGDGFACWTVYVDGDAVIWYKDGKPLATSWTLEGNPNKY